jgi:hypothetical protein
MKDAKQGSSVVKRIVYGLLGFFVCGLLGPALFLWMAMGTHSAAELGQSLEATAGVLLHYFSTSQVREAEEMVVIGPSLPFALFGAMTGIAVGNRGAKKAGEKP